MISAVIEHLLYMIYSLNKKEQLHKLTESPHHVVLSNLIANLGEFNILRLALDKHI